MLDLRKAVVAFLLLSLSPAIGLGQTVVPVKPGDSGTLTLPFKNDSDGLGDLEEVTVTVVAPPQVHIKSDSVLGPVTVPLGQTVNFVVSYEIASDATDPSYAVVLKLDFPGQITDPSADTLDTSVMFARPRAPFIVGNSVCPV